jgi:hypothetical protein
MRLVCMPSPPGQRACDISRSARARCH